MWHRSEIKARAKEILKRKYWALFLVAFALWLSGGTPNTSADLYELHTFCPLNSQISNTATREHSLQNRHWLKSNLIRFQSRHALGRRWPCFSPTQDFFMSRYGNHRMPLSSDSWLSFMLIFMSKAASILVILLMTLRVVVGYPIECGCRRYFLKSDTQQSRFSDIFYYWSSRTYFPVVNAMLLRLVVVMLWTLLLIVPGIVKSYAYKFVPFLIAEYPHLSPKNVLRLSEEMTRGHKWKIFLFDLSFIGWYLLGALLMGKGGFLVNPYFVASEAELYKKLKAIALETGAITA